MTQEDERMLPILMDPACLDDCTIPILYQPAPQSYRNKAILPFLEPFRKDTSTIPVLDICQTLEGEGNDVGIPRVLARVGGCPIGCIGCDSAYTFGVKGARVMPVSSFMNKIEDSARGVTRSISITGGEPMMYPEQMITIGDRLRALAYHVNMETSGQIIDERVFQHFNTVSIDAKTPSSGVPATPAMLDALKCLLKRGKALKYLDTIYQVKAVIQDEGDLEWVDENLRFLWVDFSIKPLTLTPWWGPQSIELPITEISDTVGMILDWNQGYNIRVIPQIHKILQFA